MFLEKILSRYGKNLTSPSKRLNDIGKMLQWHIFETEIVANLREKICRAKDIIEMIELTAQG